MKLKRALVIILATLFAMLAIFITMFVKGCHQLYDTVREPDQILDPIHAPNAEE